MGYWTYLIAALICFFYSHFKDKDIIDITLGRDEHGKLCGAMSRDLATLLKEGKNSGNLVVSGIGGVGLLTRATLLQNIFKAYELKEANEEGFIDSL